MRLLRKVSQIPCVVSLFLSSLIFASVVGLWQANLLSTFELTSYDFLLRSRLVRAPVDTRVALITIADQDIDAQGTWPLPDQTLARVLELLTQYGARAVGLDLYRHFSAPPGSEAFATALTGNPRIVAIMKFGAAGEEAIPPPEALQGTQQVGFNDFMVDPGGTVRRGLLFLDDGQQVFYSLALQLALLYLQEEGITPRPDEHDPAAIRLGPTTIRPFEKSDGGYVRADARGYQFLLDFYGAPQEFLSYSLTDLLAGRVPPEAIRNKVVLIGVAVTESVKDFFFTPFSHGRQTALRMAGISLHAHSVSQILRSAFGEGAMIRTMSDRYEVLWFFLWSMLGGSLGLWAKSLGRFTAASLGGLLLLGFLVYGAFAYGWWIPVVPPALVWLGSAGLVTAYLSNQEKEQRDLLMQLFSRHVSAEVAQTVWQQREQFLEGGRLRPQRLVASVLFSDLVGFTTVSEKLPPQDLMEWINEYMEAMAQCVAAHGGVINKYIGDSIMALFGVPLMRTTEEEIRHDAIQAVQSALAMENALRSLNQRWYAQNLPRIGMRIGIFTGPLVAGSLGSSQRLEYTVVGDTVNTASRLESFDKDVLTPETLTKPCRILVGATTAQYLGEQFEIAQVGEVKLKGKDEKVTIYHVIGPVNHGQKSFVQGESGYESTSCMDGDGSQSSGGSRLG